MENTCEEYTEAPSQTVADMTTATGIRMPRNHEQGTKPLEFCVFSDSHRQTLIFSCSACNCPDITIKEEKMYINLVYFKKKKTSKVDLKKQISVSLPQRGTEFPIITKIMPSCQLLTSAAIIMVYQELHS